MSLINDALKKAQKLRTEESGAPPPPMPGGGASGVKIAKRQKPHSANTVVLLGVGAIGLVGLSVALTIYLINRPAATPAVASKSTPSVIPPPPLPPQNAAIESPPPPSAAAVPPVIPPAAPVVKAPSVEKPSALSPAVIKQPAVAVNPAPLPVVTPVTTPSAATPIPPASRAVEPAPPISSVPAIATRPAAQPAVPNERVAAYVEALKVTAIRTSGADSRLLMNDRVYRVNDIVDRTLGVRLVKVAVDSLTFADENGVTYVKYF